MDIRKELTPVADSGIFEAALRPHTVVGGNETDGRCFIGICDAEICSRIGSMRTVKGLHSSQLGLNGSEKRETMAYIPLRESPR